MIFKVYERIIHEQLRTFCSYDYQALGVKSGVVSTGNSLDHTEMDDTLMLANGMSHFAFV